MTAAILPDFVLSVLEKEISSVVLEVVQTLCKEYKLPYEDVKKKLSKHMQIELDVNTQSNYKIIKKKVVKIKSSPETQCVANILCKDQKDIRQCTLQRIDGCTFCTKHKAANAANNLKYGTVMAPKPIFKRS
jgi:hypothetical protein